MRRSDVKQLILLFVDIINGYINNVVLYRKTRVVAMLLIDQGRQSSPVCASHICTDID
jgi:hypothetical protein